MLNKKSELGKDLRGIANAQQIAEDAIKVTGASFLMPHGLTQYKIAVQGGARRFVGFRLTHDAKGAGGVLGFSEATLFSIALNNDIFIKTAAFTCFDNKVYIDKMFFAFPRMITGGDDLLFTVYNPVADSFNITFNLFYR